MIWFWKFWKIFEWIYYPKWKELLGVILTLPIICNYSIIITVALGSRIKRTSVLHNTIIASVSHQAKIIILIFSSPNLMKFCILGIIVPNNMVAISSTYSNYDNQVIKFCMVNHWLLFFKLRNMSLSYRGVMSQHFNKRLIWYTVYMNT